MNIFTLSSHSRRDYYHYYSYSHNSKTNYWSARLYDNNYHNKTTSLLSWPLPKRTIRLLLLLVSLQLSFSIMMHHHHHFMIGRPRGGRHNVLQRYFGQQQITSSSLCLSTSSTWITINRKNRIIDQHYHRRIRSYMATSLSNMIMTEQIVKNATKFSETHLGRNGLHLLDGLDVYTVPSKQDGHPLAVYGIHSTDVAMENNRSPILLLHGRTWSSVPVYHLLGGNQQKATTTKQNHHRDHTTLESRSLIEALYHKGLQPYAMDFRGFGGTPLDHTGCVEPYRCVEDTQSVLQWIAQRHHHPNKLPALLGWSQGALIAQLVAQRQDSNKYLSKLILYASIYDPLYRYPRDPLYRSTYSDNNGQNDNVTYNDYDSAIEDFTVEGTMPPEPAQLFAEAALLCDPIKARWKHTYQFNTIDPARVQLPCLVIAGDQDPYAPLHVQQDLFGQLGRDSDRTWSILSGCDHAVHLLDGRFRLINILYSFLTNDKRTTTTMTVSSTDTPPKKSSS